LSKRNSIARNGLGPAHSTECLQRSYDGTTIMASMGSLAHYMQELSNAGFDLDDFMHEGSGPIGSSRTTTSRRRLQGWVMMEEAARGWRYARPEIQVVAGLPRRLRSRV
jgi:hypothetical protein